jgi:hypothetical protein
MTPNAVLSRAVSSHLKRFHCSCQFSCRFFHNMRHKIAASGLYDMKRLQHEDFRLPRRKDLVERGRGVCVEMVHDTEHAGRF